MEVKLYDSERKVMEVLWKNGEINAGQVAKILKEEIGWNRNTTYTVIKKCIEKGAIERNEPNFHCTPLVTKEEVQNYDTEELINRNFDGSRSAFLASFLEEKKMTNVEIAYLKKLVEKLK